MLPRLMPPDRNAPSSRSPVGSGQVRAGADKFIDDMTAVRRDLLGGRIDVYHRVIGVLIKLLSGSATDAELLERFERAWRTRSFPTFYERPLLVLAALRADALEEGPSHPLHAAIGVDTPDADLVTTESVAEALGRDRLGVWSSLTTRRVQTNDTTRALTWLWPAHLAGCDNGQRPLVLVDVGAGAGLNLVADQLPPLWADVATGKPLPTATRANIVSRLAFDTRPLNVQYAADVLWMRACIWPGETERLARFDASVQAMHAAAKRPGAPSVERLTASLVPERLTSMATSRRPGVLLLVYQTLVAGYLESREGEAYREGMLDLLDRFPRRSALWVELELDDSRRKMPAILTAHARGESSIKSLRLGRTSQHPSVVDVDVAGVAELQRLVSP